MKLRTNQQSKQLFALLHKLDLSDVREDLALDYSNQRTDRTSKLTESECQKLISDLSKQVYVEREKEAEAVIKMRRRFLAICHELKWKVTDNKLDYNRINNWLLKYSYLKKPINEYKEKELPNLITQIDNVLKAKLKQNNHAERH